jgi:hypothetical protein
MESRKYDTCNLSSTGWDQRPCHSVVASGTLRVDGRYTDRPVPTGDRHQWGVLAEVP